MSIGSGIALLVIGAVLAFAIHIPLDWIDLNVVGYIMMVAGAAVLILGIVLYVRRRSLQSAKQAPLDPTTFS